MIQQHIIKVKSGTFWTCWISYFKVSLFCSFGDSATGLVLGQSMQLRLGLALSHSLFWLHFWGISPTPAAWAGVFASSDVWRCGRSFCHLHSTCLPVWLPTRGSRRSSQSWWKGLLRTTPFLFHAPTGASLVQGIKDWAYLVAWFLPLPCACTWQSCA